MWPRFLNCGCKGTTFRWFHQINSKVFWIFLSSTTYWSGKCVQPHFNLEGTEVVVRFHWDRSPIPLRSQSDSTENELRFCIILCTWCSFWETLQRREGLTRMRQIVAQLRQDCGPTEAGSWHNWVRIVTQPSQDRDTTEAGSWHNWGRIVTQLRHVV